MGIGGPRCFDFRSKRGVTTTIANGRASGRCVICCIGLGRKARMRRSSSQRMTGPTWSTVAMSRELTLQRIANGGIVAVVRSETSAPLVKVAQALAEGGVTAAEVTFTVPDAIDVIREIRRRGGRRLGFGRRHRTRSRDGTGRDPGRRGVHRSPDPQPRCHPAVPEV